MAIVSMLLSSPRGVTHQAENRIVVVFVDDMHFAALASPNVRRMLETVRDQLIKDDDLVRVVFTGFSSRPAVTYDRDRARFNEAIRKTMGSGNSALVNPTPEERAERQRWAEIAIETASTAVRDLESATNRSKVFIYVSGGYVSDGVDVNKGLEDLALAAKRAGVVI